MPDEIKFYSSEIALTGDELSKFKFWLGTMKLDAEYFLAVHQESGLPRNVQEVEFEEIAKSVDVIEKALEAWGSNNG